MFCCSIMGIMNPEIYIASQNMVSLGTRKGTQLEARLKIISWSKFLKDEFGVGYHAMLINSDGEQFGDLQSRKDMKKVIVQKGLPFAFERMDKMSKLNASLNERIAQNPAADYIPGLSELLADFIAARWVIEFTYESATPEEQKRIDDWRNDTTLFSSLDAYYAAHPEEKKKGEGKEWTLIGIDGDVSELDKLITITEKDSVPQGEIANTKDIKGSVGYKGIVTGKARVALSPQERDAVEEGEIIVAPMTTVDFLPAMKKAAAFVTDEGGITCHAAIVAREMKKPCIIGTRSASRIIKTGDMLEVDAEKGIVRIL